MVDGAPEIDEVEAGVWEWETLRIGLAHVRGQALELKPAPRELDGVLRQVHARQHGSRSGEAREVVDEGFPFVALPLEAGEIPGLPSSSAKPRVPQGVASQNARTRSLRPVRLASVTGR